MTASALGKRPYRSHFCQVLFLLLFFNDTNCLDPPSGSSKAIFKGHFRSTCYLMFLLLQQQQVYSYTHTYMCNNLSTYVYVCTYIYVDFNISIFCSIKKKKRTLRVLPMLYRKETDSSSGWVRNKVSDWGHWQPPTHLNCHHLLELCPKNERICSWVGHWRPYEKLQCCIHILFLCKCNVWSQQINELMAWRGEIISAAKDLFNKNQYCCLKVVLGTVPSLKKNITGNKLLWLFDYFICGLVKQE